MSETDGSESPLVEASRLAARLESFAAARNWDQFHSPKNLVMALANEVGELTEIFQLMTEAESRQAMTNPDCAAAIRGEVADVLFYLIRLADILGLDLDGVARAKLALNEIRYPADKAFNSNKKYDQL